MEKRDPILREIDLEKKGIEADKEATKLKKSAFIAEIKNGLGEDIRKNPNGVKINTKTKKRSFLDFIIKLFTKF